MPEVADNRASSAPDEPETTPELTQSQTDRIVVELGAVKKRLDAMDQRLDDIGHAIGECFLAAGGPVALNVNRDILRKIQFAEAHSQQQRVQPVAGSIPPEAKG